MMNIKKISLLILATWLMTSCGGEIASNVLGDAGLLSTGLNTADQTDVELDGDVSAGEIDGDLQGASQATGDDYAEGDEDYSNVDGADLVGSGSLQPEDLTVTMSKGDSDVPPTEGSCSEETEGGFAVITDSDLPLESTAKMFLTRFFRTALAEIATQITTIGQLRENEKNWGLLKEILLDDDNTAVYQCQMVPAEDSEAEDVYEWTLIDNAAMLDWIETLEGVSLQDMRSKFDLLHIDTPIKRVEGKIQPRYVFKTNAFTGKREVFVHKTFMNLIK